MPVTPVDAWLKQLIAETAGEHGVSIHAIEVMPDHVHLFVEADPTLCVAEIAYRRKGASSRIPRDAFPHLRSRLTV